MVLNKRLPVSSGVTRRELTKAAQANEPPMSAQLSGPRERPNMSALLGAWPSTHTGAPRWPPAGAERAAASATPTTLHHKTVMRRSDHNASASRQPHAADRHGRRSKSISSVSGRRSAVVGQRRPLASRTLALACVVCLSAHLCAPAQGRSEGQRRLLADLEGSASSLAPAGGAKALERLEVQLAAPTSAQVALVHQSAVDSLMSSASKKKKKKKKMSKKMKKSEKKFKKWKKGKKHKKKKYESKKKKGGKKKKKEGKFACSRMCLN